MLLVVLSPLPLGSNREWSWALCALIAAILAGVWALASITQTSSLSRQLHPVIPAFYLHWLAYGPCDAACGLGASFLAASLVVEMSASTLGLDQPGRITLSMEDGWVALMRLLSYALVFVLAFQLGRDRYRAQSVFGWLTIAGLVYCVFGLFVFWSRVLPRTGFSAAG